MGVYESLKQNYLIQQANNWSVNIIIVHLLRDGHAISKSFPSHVMSIEQVNEERVTSNLGSLSKNFH
jgi:hypothetical protein